MKTFGTLSRGAHEFSHELNPNLYFWDSPRIRRIRSLNSLNPSEFVQILFHTRFRTCQIWNLVWNRIGSNPSEFIELRPGNVKIGLLGKIKHVWPICTSVRRHNSGTPLDDYYPVYKMGRRSTKTAAIDKPNSSTSTRKHPRSYRCAWIGPKS